MKIQWFIREQSNKKEKILLKRKKEFFKSSFNIRELEYKENQNKRQNIIVHEEQ